MSLQIFVILDCYNDLDESLKESLVVTVVEGLKILSEEGYISDDSQDVWGVDDLFSDYLSLLSDHGSDHSIEHEVLVVHQFQASESSY
jgi:hypothetical protein